MRTKIAAILALLNFVFLPVIIKCQTVIQYDKNPSQFVKPLVGTKGEGNTYPGAVAPFGMIQISPDTDDNLWETASGYEYADSAILGFSLTHFSGTGIPDLGDFRFMPQIGKPWFVQGPKSNPDSGYSSAYKHADEVAKAGYYSVKLSDNHVKVECTAADRAGMLRFTFPKTDSASILIDLAQTLMWDAVWSNVRVINDSTVTGYHIVNGWAKDRQMYFAAVFSKPLDNLVIMNDGKPVVYNGYRFRSSFEASGKNLQFLAHFKTKDQEKILVKVSVSAVSTQNALENLTTELKGKSFENIVSETQAKWDRELSKMQVEGSTELKETFYTALYHTFLTPMLYEDVNGDYRGLDHNVHKTGGGNNYAVFSLWDTYRATHPLFCLVQPTRNADMINSMLAHYDQSVEHLLPVWSLQGNETWCMIGYHAVPVIVDAMMKDLPGFDYQRAYNAMKTTALNPNYDNVKTYSQLGWVPFDKENESVSKTLEYAFDDFCIAQAAGKLGMKNDSVVFMQRAESYKNLFDPKMQLMRGRDSQGQWRTPFNSHEYVQGGDFTEATSWQYSWYVPQDIDGLIDLYGSPKAFTQKLDSLFTFNDNSSENMDDVQGRIGEYWHGNEPSHHIIYLYDFAGKPYKTQELLHKVIKDQYGNQPGSLTGNDDCGQMSAWYLFSVIGFYPVCPGSNYYAIGSPGAPSVKINFENGSSFQMKALNLSDRNIYIQKVTLNGKPWNKPYLGYSDIKNGGEIIFEMGAKPNLKWGNDVKINELNMTQ